MSAMTSEGLSPLKRAFLALEEAEARLAVAQRAAREPIAIIGLGCRIPGGAADPDGFWRLMRDGVDATGPVPAERWDHDAIYDADPATPGGIATRRGAFIDGADQFDAAFFGISPREAEGMDPQQRLFLETCWRALEHAGQASDRLLDSATGVYAGVCSSDYAYLQVKAGDPALFDAHYTSGVAHSVFSGRVSYLLGLRGPSLTVDTACSSSLVAIHLACQGLRAAECRMAIAGGVNLILAPDLFIALSHARMLAPDGRCKTFDASADGFARGEGCGVVVLKRLSDAEADGDRILAVIRGSAINQDGPSSSLTSPNGPAQEAVIRAALSFAGLAPRQLGLIEAHGTGTQLGDPMEVAALGAVFGPDRAGRQALLLGSVKSNIGHLEAAAGVAGLIKLVLALRHRTVPAHLHFTKPTPHIPWADYPFAVPTQPAPWPPIDGRRIAGVSSFGFSGTNAHIIVEEAPRAVTVAEPSRPWLLALSARDADALSTLAGSYAETLAAAEDRDLPGICRMADAGRSHFAERATIIAESADGLRSALGALAQGETVPALARARAARRDPPRIAFLFSGQGAQYAGMARGLYETAPVFRAALDRCAALLAPHLDRPLLDVLFADDARTLDQTTYTQPALFAVEWALCEQWRAWGVVPSIVIGHSVGEYIAACVAGVFDLADALRLIALRGRLMQDLPAGGAMAAIGAGEDAVARAVEPFAGRVSIAAVNGPEQTVISGEAGVIATLSATFAEQGIRAQRLSVSHAFHSPLVEPVLERFEQAMAGMRLAPPRIRLVSNVTGELAAAEMITQPAYWRHHLREAVRFGDGLRAVQAARPDCCIEIGPNATLLALASTVIEPTAVTMLASLRRGQPELRQMLTALSGVYLAGGQVNWPALFDATAHPLADLPGYPFQRQRHWFRARPQPVAAARRAGTHPLLGSRLRAATAATIHESRIAADAPDFIAQHRMLGRVILPATAYLEMLAAGTRDLLKAETVRIEDIAIGEAMELPDDGAPRLVQTVFETAGDGGATVSISSMAEAAADTAGWCRHATARVRAADPLTPADPLSLLRGRCAEPVAVADFYAGIAARGAEFGEDFHTVRALWRGDGQVLAEVALSAALAPSAARYGFHPVLLDGCLQAIAAALPADEAETALYLPIGIGACTLSRDIGAACWSHVTVQPAVQGICRADIRVFDMSGRPVAELRDVQLKRVARDALDRAAGRRADGALYEVAWRPAAVAPARAKAGPRRWLVFADGAGVAAASLARDGAVFVRPGGCFGRDAAGFTIDPAEAGDYRRLLATLCAEGFSADGVIHAWSLDIPGWETMTEAELDRSQAVSVTSLLLLAQALVGEAAPPRLWIVTRGGQDADRAASPVQAAVWGLGRSLAIEHPELRPVCIDLDAVGEDGALAAELDEDGAENQVAFRAGTRRVARLVPAALKGDAAPMNTAWRLAPATAGTFAEFRRLPAERRPPGPGEVEIAVEAAGLNFKDVLQILAMRPGDDIALGGECAGRVTAIGVGVTHLRPGDAVIAVAWGCLASHITARAELVQRRPEGMSAEEGASFLVAYLTAAFSLLHVGALRAGERVLIHAGAGGVGLAAIRIAQLAGAEIFATAGSERKRALLRSLGVAHVFDSRSPSFAAEIMARTEGRGVDLVLNSLAGAMMEASFDVLTTGGRFIELGKRDLKSAGWVAGLGRDLRYTIVDWSREAKADPALIGGMLAGLIAQLQRGEIAPLPRHVFAAEDAARAFRLMAQARHVGKIVLRHDAAAPQVARADGTYLVTGGLSGLGLRTAEWLVQRGAGRVVLLGRRAPLPEAAEAIARMGEAAVVATADVTDAVALGELLARLRRDGPPLRGIVHAAGVLDDAALLHQDADRLNRVMAPKLRGARLLDRLTRVDPLDWFVLFSSAAGVLGSAGQANYAAANAALDQVAQERRERGLCAVSIAWGAWGEIGAAVARGLAERQAARGLHAFAPAEGFRALEHILASGATQLAVMAMDWRRYAGDGATPFLSEILAAAPARPAGAAVRAVAADLRQQLADAPAGRGRRLVAEFVGGHALRILGLEPARPLDPEAPLSEFGLDSLLAVELRNTLSAALSQPLPATLLFEYPTLDALTDFLLAALRPGTAPAIEMTDQPKRSVAGAVAAPDLLGALEGLSDDEIDQMFAARMRESV
jgi:acyl transferase domain-containing protein/acyl carrier protein